MSLATAGTTATWTADEVITETALGGTQYRNNSLSLTVNLAIVGAGGVDVAGTVPTNGFMAIYAISGPEKPHWHWDGMQQAARLRKRTLALQCHLDTLPLRLLVCGA